MNKLDWSKLNNANFRLRVLSSLVLIPTVLGIVYIGGWLYNIAVMAIAALGLYEWVQIVRKEPNRHRWLWHAIGVVYLALFAVAMIALRQVDDTTVYYALVVVWGTDIGAYAAGKIIGGRKLAPAISPNKTWAGLFGGMAMAFVLGGWVGADVLGSFGTAAVLGAFLAIVAQAGDLFESYLKRRSGLKESGALIPGHGGILDRIDGLISTSIVLAVLVTYLFSVS